MSTSPELITLNKMYAQAVCGVCLSSVAYLLPPSLTLSETVFENVRHIEAYAFHFYCPDEQFYLSCSSNHFTMTPVTEATMNATGNFNLEILLETKTLSRR
jgi:hypothetical protein